MKRLHACHGLPPHEDNGIVRGTKEDGSSVGCDFGMYVYEMRTFYTIYKTSTTCDISTSIRNTKN